MWFQTKLAFRIIFFTIVDKTGKENYHYPHSAVNGHNSCHDAVDHGQAMYVIEHILVELECNLHVVLVT